MNSAVVKRDERSLVKENRQLFSSISRSIVKRDERSLVKENRQLFSSISRSKVNLSGGGTQSFCYYLQTNIINGFKQDATQKGIIN